LLIGCIGASNRLFRNNGNGTFADATESAGFYQRLFNTRAIAVMDLNKDGVADVVLTNEGQESAVLVGAPARLPVAPKTK
jgi:hypothetical protein